MESNFIKERVVIREELIKKNLKEAGKNQKQNASTSYENPPERVVVLEELINEDLKQDLVKVSTRVDSICETIADYLKIKSSLKVFKSNPNNVRLLTNIGCNFYAQCHVEDASRIFLCVGRDYFLQMDLGDALKMIDFKEKQLMKELDKLQEKASSIKAYIKIALEAVGNVYELDRNKFAET